ncbi:hypothetical protein [Intestinibacillus sp. Marseille-P6563]|uniref:hypothetical protein n=1 Tax=Intestinibacillus sp. Marseille-P6563 TaxID=2364792 RepID=UPI0013E08D71|nr:hypothetical protein [Intestinibacillus sp. Marseille-P6563]
MPISNGRYISPTWINNQSPPINASELQAITDTLQNLDGIGGSGRGYIIVGTTQSGATLSTCDYICDGASDEVEINQAIQKATEIGANILLLDGTYTVSNPILPLSNIMIEGQQYGSKNDGGTYFPNTVKITSSDQNVSSLIYMDNSFDNTLYMRGITLSNLSFPSQFLIKYGTSTGILYLSNVYMEGESVNAIIPPSDEFSLHAYNSALISSTLSLSNSYIENCSLNGISFVECGAIAQKTDTFMHFNSFFGNVTMTDCQKCTLIGNIFYGSLSLQSGSGSTTNHVCACNNIMGNTFAAGNGITLGTGTSYNNVTCNGGVAYQGGTSFTHWSGVTDNGTNNYVSNNMPTS